MVRRARSGDVETAARCELALLGVRCPTPAQVAGATLRAHQADDMRRMLAAWTEEG